ncbi:MAG: Uncharacterized methyltransferase Npun_F6389, partial [uncultured Phycisphaerae bacterium]
AGGSGCAASGRRPGRPAAGRGRARHPPGLRLQAARAGWHRQGVHGPGDRPGDGPPRGRLARTAGAGAGGAPPPGGRDDEAEAGRRGRRHRGRFGLLQLPHGRPGAPGQSLGRRHPAGDARFAAEEVGRPRGQERRAGARRGRRPDLRH